MGLKSRCGQAGVLQGAPGENPFSCHMPWYLQRGAPSLLRASDVRSRSQVAPHDLLSCLLLQFIKTLADRQNPPG